VVQKEGMSPGIRKRYVLRRGIQEERGKTPNQERLINKGEGGTFKLTRRGAKKKGINPKFPSGGKMGGKEQTPIREPRKGGCNQVVHEIFQGGNKCGTRRSPSLGPEKKGEEM